MKYIKVFAADGQSELQSVLDKHCSKYKHNIIQQCSSVAYDFDASFGSTKTKYLLTVTFDDLEGWYMILKFLKQLFCFPHHYEQELSPFDDEWWEDCRKCNKTRKVKKVII